MKAAVVVLLVSTLLLSTTSFGRDGRPRRTVSSGFRGQYIGGGIGTVGVQSADRGYGTNSSGRAVYGVVLTPGREIESTPARARWLWVDGPRPGVLKQQRARDDAFRAALQQFQEDYPGRVMPWEK